MLAVVTNRRQCREPFSDRLRRIAAVKPELMILREKDLRREDYIKLYDEVHEICAASGVPLAANFYSIPDADCIQLPFPAFLKQPRRAIVSVHSPQEAVRAERLGAAMLIAGHIFPTDCKPGLAPRGLQFLREVCQSVSLPVLAIGGVCPENAESVREAGASGACVMGEAMRSEQPEALIRTLQKLLCHETVTKT